MADGDPIRIGRDNVAERPGAQTLLRRAANSTRTDPVFTVQTPVGGDGIHGESASGTGVKGTSTGGAGDPTVGFGVHGISDHSYGVKGEASADDVAGVLGTNTSGDGAGVQGTNTSNGAGVVGECDRGAGVGGRSTSGVGVAGSSSTSTGMFGFSNSGAGVHGESPSSVAGVEGKHTGTTNVGFGVSGTSDRGAGVGGLGAGFGVQGVSPTNFGVSGTTTSGIGVRGATATASPSKAAAFVGDVSVIPVPGVSGTGILTVTSGRKNFQIDHPLDPENRYLFHTCVESSEMKNVYDGGAQLDEDGEAWVDLPEWFEALNRDFRYQLTAVGGAAPDLHVAEELSENRFKIAGGQEGMKVCWQVTGTRKDPWAAANPFEVEQEKRDEERGRYLDPSLYDAPEEQRVMIGPIAEAVEEEHRQLIDQLRRLAEEQRPEMEELRRRMDRQEEEPPEST